MSVDNSEPTPAGEPRTPIANAHFSVEARLAIQLGRESISSSITAILELVKNAYDAGADKVRVRFKGLNTPTPMMVIEDDGCGMTVDDLLNFWMVIGTTNKVKLRRVGGKRVLTGEKGLGRLGLDRLAATTNVQSIVEGASEGIELPIDWSRYEQEDVRLEKVPLQVFGIPNLRLDPISDEPRDYLHGTRLILTGLKDDWTESLLLDLRAELSLLVSPFTTGNDFTIELDSGLGLKSVDGVVGTPGSLLRAAQWKITASIDDEGMVRMRMDSAHHNRIYEDGPMAWKDRFPALGLVPACGSLKFEFYYFPRKSTNLGSETFPLTTVRTFLNSNQGLRIYRDGFRVKPYGSPNGDGDWLRLSFRRTTSPEGVAQDDEPGYWRVGYNQVVGAVFISREKNGALLDQTNREGLVVGKAFAHLRAFSEETVRFFELNRQDFEMSLVRKVSPREEAKQQADESVRAAEGALKKLTEVAGAFSALVDKQADPNAKPSSIPADATTNAVLEEVRKALDEARAKLEQSAQAYRAEDDRESQEKDTLSNLASLGILAAAFGHETLGWASSCANNAGWLERNLPGNFFFPDAQVEADVRQKLQDTITQARRIETFAEFSIGNVRPEKRKRTTFCLKRVVVNVFRTFDQSLRVQRNIELDVEKNLPDEACRIKGYPIDWESVMVNLITNAVWALNERKEIYQRVIRVRLRTDGSFFHLTFDDNGVGIAEGQEARIFLPTVSSKRNESGHICGTGMGLTIVKNFIEHNTGGTIRAVAKGELGGASFLIRVPMATSEDSPT